MQFCLASCRNLQSWHLMFQFAAPLPQQVSTFFFLSGSFFFPFYFHFSLFFIVSTGAERQFFRLNSSLSFFFWLLIIVFQLRENCTHFLCVDSKFVFACFSFFPFFSFFPLIFFYFLSVSMMEKVRTKLNLLTNRDTSKSNNKLVVIGSLTTGFF